MMKKDSPITIPGESSTVIPYMRMWFNTTDVEENIY